jgi:SAM-dependent methyltransferase
VLSLDALRRNVPAAVRVRELRWGVESHASALFAEFSGAFDLVVAADVIYDALAVIPLVETVQRLLAPAGTFVLSFTRRGVDIQLILDAALRAGLVYSDAPGLDALDIPSTERILVFTFAGQRVGAVSAGP